VVEVWVFDARRFYSQGFVMHHRGPVFCCEPQTQLHLKLRCDSHNVLAPFSARVRLVVYRGRAHVLARERTRACVRVKSALAAAAG